MIRKAKAFLQAMDTKQKRMQALAVMIIAVIIALAGTFAWQSFNQRIQNIFHLTSSPNVNLHDDFAGGPKKDVYVENSGRLPVLVRVRLTELLRLGGRVLPEDAVDGDERINWHIHTPETAACSVCAFEAHRYYTWVMDGQKFYMPAHQSAKGSHTSGDETASAGVTGGGDEEEASADSVYTEPIAVGDKVRIIDYRALLMNAFQEIYFDDQTKLSTLLGYINEYTGGDDTNAAYIQQEIESIPDNYLVKNVKQYDDQPAEEHTRRLNEVRLTLIPTQIISIYDWILGTTYGEPRVTGDFWIMDSDGWCYWANALAKNQATGLLISSVINENKYSGGNITYKINVHLHATTFAGPELNTFFLKAQQNGGITENAMELMFLASGEHVRGADGGIYFDEGNGVYRKIEKNPKTDSYVNYISSNQIYAGMDEEIGTSDDIGPVLQDVAP